MTIGLATLGYKSLGNPNRGQICIGQTEVACDCFINLLKACSFSFFNGGMTPAVLDDTGYPVQAFTGDYGGLIGGTPSSLGPYILAWPAGRSKFCVTFSGITATTSSTSNCTIQNNASNDFGVTGDGTNAGFAIFTFASVFNNIAFYFRGKSGAQAYGAGSGDMTLMLVSDQTAYNAGEIFTPGFISTLTALSPKTLRMMPVIMTGSINLNSDVKWRYRNGASDLSWTRAPYKASLYGGNINSAGSGQYPTSKDQLTMAAPTDMLLSSWADGEQFTGNIQTAQTGFDITGIVAATGTFAGKCKVAVSQSTANLATGQQIWLDGIGGTTEAQGVHTILVVDDASHFTIDVVFVNTFSSSGQNQASVTQLSITGKAGGAKFVGNANGSVFTSMSSGLTGFHFDANLNKIVQHDVTNQPPVEIQCRMANRFNCDLWSNIPPYADADYVTQWATTIRDNLRPAACFFAEYGNEMDFNTGFSASLWAYNSAGVLGFSRKNRDWYMYKIAQFMPLVKAAWTGRLNQLRRVLCSQKDNGAIDTNAWKGSSLAAYGYNVSPNRPIDQVECIAYAPYAGGRNISGGADLNFGVVAAQTSWFQTLVTLWDGGSTAAAIAMIDDDVRQGRYGVQTATASGTTFTTPLAHGFVAGDTCVQFQVTGGTAYSGVATNKVYQVVTTPLSTTFTIKNVAGATINGGSAGTGTMTVGNAGRSFNSGANQVCWTVVGHSETISTFWEANAASFDADRPAGALPLKIVWYEGALELVCPDITGLVLTGTNPTASVVAAITAWRLDPMARDTIIAYYRQFMGTDAAYVTYQTMTHAVASANLSLGNPGGGEQYAFLASGINSTRNKMFDGFASFSLSG